MPGAEGPRGQKGELGPMGLPGLEGPSGDAGMIGPPGAPGRQGTPGIQVVYEPTLMLKAKTWATLFKTKLCVGFGFLLS